MSHMYALSGPWPVMTTVNVTPTRTPSMNRRPADFRKLERLNVNLLSTSICQWCQRFVPRVSATISIQHKFISSHLISSHLKHPTIQPRCAAAHLTACLLPFSTSTPNQITNDAAVQIANRNGNPCQLFCVLSMIAWTTYGPIIEEARLERPKRPKNCVRGSA